MSSKFATAEPDATYVAPPRSQQENAEEEAVGIAPHLGPAIGYFSDVAWGTGGGALGGALTGGGVVGVVGGAIVGAKVGTLQGLTNNCASCHLQYPPKPHPVPEVQTQDDDKEKKKK